MQTATIKFRPLERETLELLMQVNASQEGDPIATYGRLMSAASLAAAIIGLRADQVTQQVEAFLEQATKAVQERPDIFGKSGAMQ